MNNSFKNMFQMRHYREKFHYHFKVLQSGETVFLGLRVKRCNRYITHRSAVFQKTEGEFPNHPKTAVCNRTSSQLPSALYSQQRCLCLALKLKVISNQDITTASRKDSGHYTA